MSLRTTYSSAQKKVKTRYGYSTIQLVDRKSPTPHGLHPICITCRHFQYIKLFVAKDREATDVFMSLQKLMNVSVIEQLYAFHYKPTKPLASNARWRRYDPAKEFARLGVETVTDQWRFTAVNENYEFSPTYPSTLVVPAKISDNVLRYTGKFRSKARIPALSYLHKSNMASITRCSQPLVGLKQNRSIQDEKLVEAIFASTTKPSVATPFTASNLIVDARPTANALAQTALGAGTESVENYKCKIAFLGIDNIHVVRDSMNKLMEAMNAVETGPVPKAALHKSGWLKHIRHILDGSATIVKHVHLHNSHVLVHCSDGWDRTAQLCSLAEICLDPYYRTIEGLAVLIEKEWVSFGHKFRDRCGHLSRENSLSGGGSSVGAHLQAAGRNVSNSISSVAKSFLGKNAMSIAGFGFGGSTGGGSPPPNGYAGQASPHLSPGVPSSESGGSSNSYGQAGSLTSTEVATPNSVAPREVSPVFSQFLDCLYQLWVQFPTHFEFSERLLSALHLHVYACQFGNFLFNCERELRDYRIPGSDGRPRTAEEATFSVWNFMHANREEYLNPHYVAPEERAELPGGIERLGAGMGAASAAGSVPGAPGTTSPDGSILYPSTANLRYWAGLCLREEEIEQDSEMPGAEVGINIVQSSSPLPHVEDASVIGLWTAEDDAALPPLDGLADLSNPWTTTTLAAAMGDDDLDEGTSSEVVVESVTYDSSGLLVEPPDLSSLTLAIPGSDPLARYPPTHSPTPRSPAPQRATLTTPVVVARSPSPIPQPSPAPPPPKDLPHPLWDGE
ncbi:hypothetical protein HKX48_001895 [Thoreauomyces humboldtii]|nr:hypothetical protein HKX48_001895 [Thoreauomyces humboldtii]